MDSHKTVSPPRFILGALSESEGPNIIISILLSLKFKKFRDSQAFIPVKQAMRVSRPSELNLKADKFGCHQHNNGMTAHIS